MSGVKMHETVIDGATWQLNNLDAERGVDVLARIAAIVGGPLGDLLGSLMGTGKALTELSTADLPREALSKVLGTLLSQMHTGGAKDIIRTLLTGLKREKQAIDYATFFASNYGQLFRLVWWALEINYKSFFGESTALFAGLQAPPQGQKSPQT